MTVQTELSEISPVMVEVKVEVPWETVNKELSASFKTLARTAKVRGFRPGKVPTHVVRKLYGAQVEAEVTGTLVERGLMKAVQNHEIQIVAQPEVDEPVFTKGESLRFSAKIEVQPVLQKVDLSKLTIGHKAVTVSEEAVSEAIERLRHSASDLREPEPMRGAKPTDLLTIDYAVRVDGELHPDLGAEAREVDLGDEGLLDAFRQGLLGLKPGESKNVEVTFPEDNPREELAGKPAVFEVQLKELKERLLPELDDDFAQDVGEHKTLADLKAQVRADLEKENERREESILREKLIDKLIATNEIPVPPSMLKQQRQQMMYEFVQFAQMTGQQIDPSMLGDVDGRAERRVKAGIVLGALARIESMNVTREELDAKLASIAEDSGKHIAKVKVEYSGERREQLENQLLEEKIVGFLKSKATIDENMVEASTVDETTEKAPKKAPKKPAKKAPKKAKADTSEESA